jgi:hypothetical protein
LRSLLLTPGIHRGTVVRPAQRIATGLATIDTLLDGGLPAGAITELVGARSSGKTSLGYALAAALTGRGAFTAYVDVADAFDPEHAATAGVRLHRLLWIRPPDVRAALRAAEYVVETGGFTLIVVDLGDPTRVPDGTASTTWLRLARSVAATKAAIVIVGMRRNARASAAVSLETSHAAVSFSGGMGRALFDGIASTIECRKNKLGPPPAPTRLVAATA